METDSTYIKAVLNGDQQAYHHLVTRYQNFVFTISLRILKRKELAEEAAQDTFVKAFYKLNTFQGTAKFSSWLYKIAYRTALDHQRKIKTPMASIDDQASYFQIADHSNKSATAEIEQKEKRSYIERAIEQLPPVDAALITLFYLKTHSIEEIAEILDLSVSNVKVKLFRNRQKLKEILGTMLLNPQKELS